MKRGLLIGCCGHKAPFTLVVCGEYEGALIDGLRCQVGDVLCSTYLCIYLPTYLLT